MVALGRYRLFLLLAAAILLLDGASAARITGDRAWRPIKNTSDPHLTKIAEFAVKEHNEKEKQSLQFQRVLSGEIEVVAGINYRLVIAAAEAQGGGGDSNKYEVVVWEKAWLNFRKLISFKHA